MKVGHGAVALGTVLCAVALAACGGGSGSGGGEARASAEEAGLEFAECMRGHGVEVEDPRSGKGIAVEGNDPKTKKALAACRDLARADPTLQSQYALASHLADNGQEDEARELLERSLESYRYAPGFVRRRNRAWVGRARQLLRQLES